MDKTYKVQEIFKWWSNFSGKTLCIKTENKNFIIDLNEEQLPHLLGLQYMGVTINDKPLKGRDLYNYTKNNNLFDQEIYDNILDSINKHMLKAVKIRIDTFPTFMKNLENSCVVKNIYESKIKSKDLVIQDKDNRYLHLALKDDEKNKIKLEDYIVYDEKEILKKFIETYYSTNKIKYFDPTKDMSNVLGIYILEKDKLIPFSFDDEKNKKLLEEYERDQDDGWDKFFKKEKNDLTR